jgi:hypothetical protein
VAVRFWETFLVRLIAGAIGLTCALVFSAPQAVADEDKDPTVEADVRTRPRPEYDAIGIRLGSFFFYPSLTAGFGYNDNVFNNTSAVGDYFYAVAPNARLESGWSRHSLQLSVGSKSYWYSNQITENRTDWNADASARIDIVRGSDIKLGAHFGTMHEPRGTELPGGLGPGDAAEPTSLSHSEFSGEIGHTLNRLRLSLGGSLAAFDYDDTPVIQPGPLTLNNDDRDRTDTSVFVKAVYEVSPSTGVFLRGRIEDHDFETPVDDDGFNRDSSGWGVDGGLEFHMTHVLVGELFAGYTVRSYDDLAFEEANQFGFGAGLKWFPTMLTTVSIDAERSIEDTSITASSGYLSTRGQIGIDHELLRNVVLSGRLGYQNAEYLDVTRNDDILNGSLGGRYLINQNLHFDVGWDYTNRSSSAAAFDYSSSQFQLSITGKM